MDINKVSDFWQRLDLALVIGRKSLKDVCGAAGIAYQTMINQKCLKKYPSVITLIKLSGELGCSLDWLVLGIQSAQNEPFKANSPIPEVRLGVL